ncbi:Putative papain-like cysteine peptidase [Flavobacterium caeni]|uniref:Putative papain-like cysteine peptidase n=2 Tax=Flavobacterium caeni TaxID=490189 RepID=A0A1G5IRZ4_9FLAO|nr:Putative papain-like cysteine peptidase [Flavobacterium caeni]
MRIPLIYIPKTKYKKFLYIRKKYYSKYPIIPIGCDCHPAHTLNSLFLRKISLPFDWLNIEPIHCFNYINDNINCEFSFFKSNVITNERGYFIASKYPSAEFIHEKKLDSSDSQEKFDRRIARFTELLPKRNIFIHNIPANSIKNKEDITVFIESIVKFKEIIHNGSTIHIYIRFDENITENETLANELYVRLINSNIETIKYVRKLNKFGIWGDKKEYYRLLKNLKINIKQTFPNISIK